MPFEFEYKFLLQRKMEHIWSGKTCNLKHYCIFVCMFLFILTIRTADLDPRKHNYTFNSNNDTNSIILYVASDDSKCFHITYSDLVKNIALFYKFSCDIKRVMWAFLFQFEGRKYCEHDFRVLFAPSCGKCGKYNTSCVKYNIYN